MKTLRDIHFATKSTAIPLFATALLMTWPAFAEEWHLASPYPEASYMTKSNQKFADDVAKATEGRVKITVHAGASLYKLPEIKRAVETGQIALGEVLLGALANEDPVHGVGMMPFLTRDINDARALWEAQRPLVAEKLDKQGLVLLHGVVWPGQSLFTRKPINSFEELKGMKFRVQNPTTARLAELMGVTGVRVETVDIPQAFLTGIIDGMYTSNVTTANLKGWDYIKYTYETNAWYPKNITFANKAMWDKLDEKDRKAILEASKKAETRGWAMEAKETEEKTKLLAEKGVTVTPPPAELQNEFESIGKKMVEEWKASAKADGERLLSEYERLRAK